MYFGTAKDLRRTCWIVYGYDARISYFRHYVQCFMKDSESIALCLYARVSECECCGVADSFRGDGKPNPPPGWPGGKGERLRTERVLGQGSLDAETKQGFLVGF